MKKGRLILFLILACGTCFVLEARDYYAIVIGISAYPEESEWWNISAQNDVELLLPQLQKQKFNIVTLQNERATKRGIINEFEKCINRMNPGDFVFIHFSTHGQQMEDDNADEPDGWDEALIPYDAELSYEKGVYEGENHLRDDEFNLYLLQMRKKIGGEGTVIVSLDACHSASATRDEDDDEILRGTSRRFTPTGKLYSKSEGQNQHYIDTPLMQSSLYGSLTVVSACKSYQVNQEIKRDNKSYGPLSYYLAQMLQTKSLEHINDWIPTLLTQMKRNTKQTPIVESTLPIQLYD